MTATLNKMLVRTMGADQWWGFQELYHEFRHRIDGPGLQKTLSNLVVGGVLEKHETSDRVSYKVRKPPTGEELSGDELTDLVLNEMVPKFWTDS
jgi:hypothetical protein